MKRLLHALTGSKRRNSSKNSGDSGTHFRIGSFSDKGYPMLVNINQGTGRNYDGTGGGGGGGAYQSNKSKSIARQLSSVSIKSNRSEKSGSNKANNLKKKIEEHKLRNDTSEWQKEQEYNIRRRRKKERRKILQSKSMLKLSKKLFVAAVFSIVLGIVMLFGATIRTLGDGTMFYTHKQYFKIIGPAVIVAGIVFLLTAIGIETNTKAKLKEAGEIEIHPFIHPDFNRHKKDRTDSKSSDEGDSKSEQSGSGRKSKKWYETQTSTCSTEETELLCSSWQSSSCASPAHDSNSDMASRWARLMATRIEDNRNETPTTHTNDKSGLGHDDCAIAIPRVDSELLRKLHNAPRVKVTEIDECFTLSSLSRTNTSESSFSKEPSSNYLVWKSQDSETVHGTLISTRTPDRLIHRNGFVLNIEEPSFSDGINQNVDKTSVC